MTSRGIGAWLLRRWPAVGGALILVAAVVAVFLGLSGSRGILAQADPTPVVITEETMHLLPPFDPNAVPDWPDPPCLEDLKNPYDLYPTISISITKDSCYLYGPSGRVISEAQAQEMISAGRVTTSGTRTAQIGGNTASQISSGPTRHLGDGLVGTSGDARSANVGTSVESIELDDGSVIQLPSDVRIDRELFTDVTHLAMNS